MERFAKRGVDDDVEMRFERLGVFPGDARQREHRDGVRRRIRASDAESTRETNGVPRG